MQVAGWDDITETTTKAQLLHCQLHADVLNALVRGCYSAPFPFSLAFPWCSVRVH